MGASQEVNLLHAFSYGFFFSLFLNYEVAKKLITCGSEKNRIKITATAIIYSVLIMYQALDLTSYISRLGLIMTL